MINKIKGRIVRKTPTEVTVEVSGIGFAIAISLNTYDKIGGIGQEVDLETYLHVREDALLLFGFHTLSEREVFLILLAVTGVGPRLALAILSRFSPDELVQVISSGDSRRLTTVKGIGQRTAERLYVELKGKLKIESENVEVLYSEPSVTSESIQALETLGFTLNQAEDAVRGALKKLGENASTEEIVRNALKG